MRAPWRSSWVVMVSSKSSPMRTPYSPAARRRILCVYPVYARSFGTFQHAYPFFGRRGPAFLHPAARGSGSPRPPGGAPRAQRGHERVERLPLAAFPTPAYELIRLREYFIANIQFSSGCPYACEFCDIPALYGRNPRLKTPEQVCRELDLIAAAGCTSVYFVDDNFIGNQKATLELLPHLVAGKERHRDPLRLACEDALIIAKNERTLALMRQAGFITVFFRLQTPAPHPPRFTSPDQHTPTPTPTPP